MLFGRKTSEENKICENLTYKENELCFQQIGVKCKSLSTSIVQVFQTSPPKHDKWRKVESGVLCFVKDNQKKSYFFKLVKLDNSAVVVWEEEIYIGLVMERIKPFLISFEGQVMEIKIFVILSDDAVTKILSHRMELSHSVLRSIPKLNIFSVSHVAQ